MDSTSAPQAPFRVLNVDRRSPNSPSSTRFNYLPKPPASIENLPPEMLTIVLSDKQFTLPQRIALRAVSSHWQEVIEEHIFKKKTTELVLSNDDFYGNKSNRLPYKDELIPLVIRLFPALTNLTLDFYKQIYRPLPHLLTTFTTTLTTLKLVYSDDDDFNSIYDPSWSANLATTINNSLIALTDLDLYNPPDVLVLLEALLPTLGRLQRFAYFVEYNEPQIWPRLITANNNQSLTSMTHLRIDDGSTFDTTATVLDIITIFPSLQSLVLWLHPYENVRQQIRLIDIFRSLSTLKHLTEFTLGGILYTPSNQLNLLLPSFADQRLSSVTKLTLSFRNDINEVLSSLIVGWFPSLEVLTLSWLNRFQLTTSTLRNFTRLQQLKVLDLYRKGCYLPVELIFDPAEHRPLTCLKKLGIQLDEDYAAEQLCCTALVGWFPSLTELFIKFAPSRLLLTTALFRDISRLENLSILHLTVVHFEADQLHLPTSSDRRLVNVKTLHLTIYLKESADNSSINGRYLCTVLAAWFPGLQRLDIPRYPLEICLDTYNDVFTPSIAMISQLATLEHLTKLHLSEIKFTKEHFSLPTSADQVLANLKKLDVRFDDWTANHFDDGDECHLISAITAWFPNLEKLTITIYDHDSFYLTSDLLRQLGQLKHLCKLRLPLMLYEKKHLQVPSPTDRPLTCLKELKLNMTELPENFDSSYFCSTLAAWFPNLEKITLGPQHISDDDPVLKDRLTAYKTAIKANPHHFGRLVQMPTAFDRF